MRTALIGVILGLALAWVQTYGPKSRTPERSSARASDKWELPQIDLSQFDGLAEPSPAFPSEAAWISCWFGKNKRFARMVSTTPKGLAVARIYRHWGGAAGYPSRDDVRDYLCDIGKVSFSYVGSSLHVGDGIEWFEKPHDPRFPDVIRTPDLLAPRWPLIKRFDLQRSGDLLADVPPPELGIYPEEPRTYRLLISR